MMRPRRNLLVPIWILALALGSTSVAVVDDAEGMPAWAEEEMTALVGRWVADNSAYQGPNEPYDAYGLEWEWGLGKKSLKGRLFGLVKGKESGTFWEFRQFWHPGDKKMMLHQYGLDGTVGIGSHERLGENRSQSLQTFYNPAGTTSRVGHRTTFKDGEQHGHSYDVDDAGTWKERRFYIWKRVEKS